MYMLIDHCGLAHSPRDPKQTVDHGVPNLIPISSVAHLPLRVHIDSCSLSFLREMCFGLTRDLIKACFDFRSRLRTFQNHCIGGTHVQSSYFMYTYYYSSTSTDPISDYANATSSTNSTRARFQRSIPHFRADTSLQTRLRRVTQYR